MKEDSTVLIPENRNNTFKMTKTRASIFLLMIIVSCALVLTMTEAYPTSQPEPEVEEEPDSKLNNTSRLVITNVIKTIEFEVGVIDDDVNNDNDNREELAKQNETDDNISQYYETDIQLLNLGLLKAIVDEAENNKTTDAMINEEVKEGTEEQVKQMDAEQENKMEKSIS